MYITHKEHNGSSIAVNSPLGVYSNSEFNRPNITYRRIHEKNGFVEIPKNLIS